MTDVYQPPFTVNAEIVALVAEISETLGRLALRHESSGLLRLRRADRIRTVQGSLAIEGNSLTEEQITAILEGKRVLAPAREIQEARNALLAYERLLSWRPNLSADLLAAHAVLMEGLVDVPGVFRTAGVGIMKGQDVIHLAPPADRVPALMKDLLAWIGSTKDHPLIASSVFHYEAEFIHPFPDGNGRMGRLWQTLMLARWNPLMAFMPVETMIHRNQAEYYAAINRSTAVADSAAFIAFMLRMIRDAVAESAYVSEKMTEKTSEKILALINENTAATIAELARITGLSARTIERNIKALRNQGRLLRIGPDKGGHWKVLEREP